jgi:putative FmdB family regulatory protein
MPLYEFRCEKCRKVMQCLCRVGTNGKGLACPSCGGRKLRRIMSVFSARVAGGTANRAMSGSSCSNCSGGNCAHCH